MSEQSENLPGKLIKDDAFDLREAAPERSVASKLRENYDQAIDRPFEGIAFDLDGTAFDENGNLTPDAVHLLTYLLRCHIPVIVSTGRGEGSTDDKVVKVLHESGGNMENLIVSNYNGARISRFEYKKGELVRSVLSESLLRKGTEILDDLTTQSPWHDSLITADRAFVSKARPQGITLVFKEDKIPDPIDIYAYLQDKGYSGGVKVISSGKTIDIISSAAGKGTGIDIIADRLSLEPNDIARVGDRGKIGENDFEMINHPSGFTVGTREEGLDRSVCHQVVDPEGTVLTGIEAFKQLLFDIEWKAGIVVHRSTFSNKYSRAGYMDEYHRISELAKNRFSELSLVYELRAYQHNQVLNQSEVSRRLIERQETGRQLKDEFSYNGAVIMSRSELNSLPDSPLRSFINTRSTQFGNDDNPRYKYMVQNVVNEEARLETREAMQTNLNTLEAEIQSKRRNSSSDKLVQPLVDKVNRIKRNLDRQGLTEDVSRYFCRAESYYASMQDSEDTAQRFDKTFSLYSDLRKHFYDIQAYIESNRLSVAEWKAALTYFDHLKSAHLQVFHAVSYLRTANLLPLEDEESSRLNESLRQSCIDSVGAYYDLLNLQTPRSFRLNSDVSTTRNLVIDTLQMMPESSKKTADKSVRGLSEGDHPFYENIYSMAATSRLKSKNYDSLVLAGLHYGGIELPFVLASEFKRLGVHFDLELVALHYSKYSNRALNSSDVSGIDQISDKQIDWCDKTVVLLDDGIFSGESLYKVGLLATYEGAEVLFSTMAVGNSRRLGQMMETGGAEPDFINTELLSDIVRVSPFAKASNLEEYRSQLHGGKFNLVKRSVIKMLLMEYDETLVKGKDQFARLRNR